MDNDASALDLYRSMDAFSYLSVLLSIVLGLGLTQILTASGRIIRHRDRVRLDWLPLLWAAVLLVVYVQAWWAMFGLRGVRQWTFVGFITVLAETATLYLMAVVVLPEQIDEAGVDLADYYQAHHRWLFGCFVTTLVVSVAKDVVIGGRLPEVTNLVFHGVLATACIVGIVVSRRRVQEIVGVACAGTLGVYIALLFTRLR